MIWLLKNWKILTAIGLAVGIFFAGYFKGADSTQRKWDEEKAAMVKAQLKASVENQAAIAQLQETKNANLKVISGLRRDLNTFRVRLPSGCTTVTTTGGSEVPIETGGVLHGSVEGVLGADRQRTAGIVEAAEVELNDCRVIKEWAKVQSIISSPPK